MIRSLSSVWCALLLSNDGSEPDKEGYQNFKLNITIWQTTARKKIIITTISIIILLKLKIWREKM